MKKKVLILSIIILLLVLVLGMMYVIDSYMMKNNKPVIFSTWGYDYVPPINIDETKIDNAIKQYLDGINESKKNNEKWFYAIKKYLIHEIDDNNIIVYAWVLEESYYKENDVAINESGASIPYKFTLNKTDNEYKVINHEMPSDGGKYSEDMKRIFPKDVLEKIDKIYIDGTMDELKDDIDRQVSKYFNIESLTIPYNSFIGTILEETTTYMIVEPNEDEIERKSSDKIMINYGVDHNDYLYGVGRKVLINYTGYIMETYPAQINTNNISTQGYSDFEILVKESSQLKSKKILNNKELYKYNSDYDLYYYGLEEVEVKVDDKTNSLEEALRSGRLTLDGIIAKANEDAHKNIITSDMYKDGGSMIYYYDNYTILKFHNLDGNRNIYIGIKDMNINNL